MAWKAKQLLKVFTGLQTNPAKHPKMIHPEEIIVGANSATRNAETLPEASRILLVEDDRALRRYLEIVLERSGYRVALAADGLEAMKVVLTSSVDIVVTDAMMPNLNGYELCRFIKSSSQLSHLPVILLSALDRQESQNEAEQVDAFLAKPVSTERLVECIEGLLARSAKRF